MNTTTKQEAERAGFHALTTPYQLPGEERMLQNVLADMARGNIETRLVKCGYNRVEVWRRPSALH
jgi:hypothetical protein